MAAKVVHTADGGNIVTKGNTRITTRKCGCITREKFTKRQVWVPRFQYVCAYHAAQGGVQINVRK